MVIKTFFLTNIFTGAFRRKFQAQQFTTVDELLSLVRDKLHTNQHWLRHMFMLNDFRGRGVISREALLKILSSACGPIQDHQYAELLKQLKLETAKAITFEMFVAQFNRQDEVGWFRITVFPSSMHACCVA